MQVTNKYLDDAKSSGYIYMNTDTFILIRYDTISSNISDYKKHCKHSTKRGLTWILMGN